MENQFDKYVFKSQRGKRKLLYDIFSYYFTEKPMTKFFGDAQIDNALEESLQKLIFHLFLKLCTYMIQILLY